MGDRSVIGTRIFGVEVKKVAMRSSSSWVCGFRRSESRLDGAFSGPSDNGLLSFTFFPPKGIGARNRDPHPSILKIIFRNQIHPRTIRIDKQEGKEYAEESIMEKDV